MSTLNITSLHMFKINWLLFLASIIYVWIIRYNDSYYCFNFRLHMEKNNVIFTCIIYILITSITYAKQNNFFIIISFVSRELNNLESHRVVVGFGISILILSSIASVVVGVLHTCRHKTIFMCSNIHSNLSKVRACVD